MVASILLTVLLLGENLQFEKTYFTSYKELVSGYFQEGSEEAVQKARRLRQKAVVRSKSRMPSSIPVFCSMEKSMLQNTLLTER